ncbi:hypothetical protein LWI28_027642 [Acer negundo]|uniref:Uncharacterized protein n=1 Tax=Acer negundo TaxID=4023 RepID=A0AAD5JRR1_ACENE|nr:hypothetical protein LWI28_027642 [Acer negundo]
MDSPRTHEPATFSARRRSSSDSNSPEFEFWMVRNPSFPQPNLLSADELFVDGVLLPLHLLSHHSPDPHPDPEPPKSTTEQPQPEPDPESEAGPGPELSHVKAESGNGSTSSKRWTDIFKKGDKKSAAKIAEEKDRDREKEKEKKREKKSQTGGASSAAELNINIWPFSRSRSAGNSVTRPRLASGAPGNRKVSSAPCSRSNSAGESKSRKWPSSPGRPGVHLGRSSPIWQVKRGGEKGVVKREVNETRSGKSSTKPVGNGNSTGTGAGGGKVRVLNLNVNVPMCIGYRPHLGCRSDENSAIGVDGVGNNKPGNGTGNGDNGNVTSSTGNLFNLRSLFTKKVY